MEFHNHVKKKLRLCVKKDNKKKNTSLSLEELADCISRETTDDLSLFYLAKWDVHHVHMKMADDLMKSVNEIQISQRFMLKRINELYHSSGGQCTCARKQEQYRKAIYELESKVNELETIIDEKETFQKEREKEHQELKDRVELLETFVLTLQTDDSKIHSASLKKEQNKLKPKQIVTKGVKGKNKVNDADEYESSNLQDNRQVYQTYDTQYSEPIMDKSDSADSRSSHKLLKETESYLKAQSKDINVAEQAPDVENDEYTNGEREKQNPSNLGLPKILQNGDEGASKNATTTMNSRIKMVNQPERKTHGNEHFWRYIAQVEMDDGKRTLKDLQGVHTVIILDISASMAEENAWTQALTFVRNYLNGLDDISNQYVLSKEHVALVTFGHETRVQQRLTNNYNLIRQLVENQRLGGPSPLYGGLILALAAARSSNHQVEVVNNMTVFTKVIIVTDGLLTEVGQYEGPDNSVGDLNETKAKLIQCMEEYKGSHLDTYYVQVGKGNEETRQFSELMMAVVDGKRLDFNSGRQFSRRLYLTSKIQDPYGLLDPVSLFKGGLSDSDEDFSEEDKFMIDEIKHDAHKGLFTRIQEKQSTNMYRELPGTNLPPIGSRVRRGPDWQWKMQDSNGLGTVIGHDYGEQVWVDWDKDGHKNIYRYGQPGYDVLIVDEPRELNFGQEIAVGCVVKPGKDWTKFARNAQNWQRGVVINVIGPKATVRWDNGERHDYTYSETGKCEIEVCSGFRAFRSEGHVLGSDWTDAPQEKKTRNKNKNV